MGGSLIKQPYTTGGSGSIFIAGYCDANFKPNMTKEETIEFVKTAISHAMARDGSSGGIMRLVNIDKNGITRQFVDAHDLKYQSQQIY